MNPPGSANALMVLSRTKKNEKRCAESPVACATIREPERLEVFGGLGVFDDLAFVAQLAHDLQADAVFVVERQRGGGRAADVGQVVARRGLRQRLQRQQRSTDNDAPAVFSARLASRFGLWAARA